MEKRNGTAWTSFRAITSMQSSIMSRARANLDLRLHAPGPDGINASLDSDLDDTAQLGVLHVTHQVDEEATPGLYLLRVVPFSNITVPTQNRYYAEVRVRRSCIEDLLEVDDNAFYDLGGTFPIDQPNLALCNDEDWFEIDVDTGNVVTVCLNFVHDDGDIDLELYGGIMEEEGVLVGDPATLEEFSYTKQDQESLTLSVPPGAPTPYYIRVFLDPRDEVSTTYGIQVLDGAVACP